MKKYQILLITLFISLFGLVVLRAEAKSVKVDFDEEDAFCRVFLAQDTITHGDIVLLTYRFYTRLNINVVENIEYPNYDGFAFVDIDLDENAEFELEIYNEKEYYAVDIRRVLLYARDTGTKTIPPAKMEVIFEVSSAGKKNDMTEMKHIFSTDTLILEVMDDRPAEKPIIEELDNTRDLII